jgi:hypothetical protein
MNKREKIPPPEKKKNIRLAVLLIYVWVECFKLLVSEVAAKELKNSKISPC